MVAGRKKPLNPLLRDEIYRIGREGLSNAFRHSHAHHIEVKLVYGHRSFGLTIRDDGRGVDSALVNALSNSHKGLFRMREWANRTGGKLRVYSKPPAPKSRCTSPPGSLTSTNPRAPSHGSATHTIPPTDSSPRSGRSGRFQPFMIFAPRVLTPIRPLLAVDAMRRPRHGPQ